MTQIEFSNHYNEGKEIKNYWAGIHPKDLIDFVEQLSKEPNLNGKMIIINSFEQLSHEYSTMTKIVVKFQFWKTLKTGTGEKFCWVASRAKDFSCGNYSITRI